ncbi:hypothetical protein LTR62_008420 [Meristemomyces frigidus]|uniref:Fe2OG dioxygenase domain-containing protein n=1 Tax=Meristemomyces frigidus TaxID=1508187 RepID=A0AAN7YN82_9PEZI|nr:hypothetical protein LTR62_008420 [Meristemomyces frigidus]
MSSALLALLSQSTPNIRTRKAVIVLGLQNDFLSPAGKLPVNGRSGFLGKIKVLVPAFREYGEAVWVRTEVAADSHSHTVNGYASETVTAGKVTTRRSSTAGQPGSKRCAHGDGIATTKRARGRQSDDDPELCFSRTRDREPCCIRSTWGAEHPQDVQDLIEPQDLKIVKTAGSAFISTHLLTSLRMRLVTELYVCGCLTNFCVFATAMDAARYGIRITLIEDCLGYRQQEKHDMALRQLVDLTGAHIMLSDQVITDLRHPTYTEEDDEPSDDGNASIEASSTTIPAEISSPTAPVLAIDEVRADDIIAADSDEEEGEMALPQVRPPALLHKQLSLRYSSVLSRNDLPQLAPSTSATRYEQPTDPGTPIDKPLVLPNTSAEKLVDAAFVVSKGSAGNLTECRKSQIEPPEDCGLDALPVGEAGSHEESCVPAASEALEREHLDIETEGDTQKENTNDWSVMHDSCLAWHWSEAHQLDVARKCAEAETLLLAPTCNISTGHHDMSPENSGNNLVVNVEGTRPQESRDFRAEIPALPAGDVQEMQPADPNSPNASTELASGFAITGEPGAARSHSQVDMQAVAEPHAGEQTVTATSPGTESGLSAISTTIRADSKPLLGEDREAESQGSRMLYGLLPPGLSATIFNTLKTEVTWQTMHHLTGEVPRLVCCQGTIAEDSSVPVYRHPSDQTMPLHTWSPTVQLVKDTAERVVGHELNHVLLQLYRSGTDFISEHSDKTLDIAPNSHIVNVSFGAQRTMRLRTKRVQPKSAETTPPRPEPRTTHRVPLPHNSCLTMSLPTNAKYLHSIPADKRLPTQLSAAELAYSRQRISLTFRRIATFLSADEERIWGQGATTKRKEEAGRVVPGGGEESERLVRAFGAENASRGNEGGEGYGPGSDVLHLRRGAGS